MKLCLLFKPLGDGAPFAPSRKEIPPLLIGAAMAAGSSLMNQSLNRSNLAYKSEMEKGLMDYEWQNYKSPQAQVHALTQAGLNPAAFFGGGAGSVATPSHSAVSDSPLMVDGVDVPRLLLTESEILKNTADAKKAGSEAEGRDIENRLATDTYKDRVEEIALRNKWTKEQTSKTIQEVGLLCATFNETQQKIENLRSEKKLTDKQVDWYNRHMKAEIEHLRSSAEYQRAIAGLTDSQKTLFDRTMDDMAHITSLNRSQMDKVVELLNKYGDAKEIIGMITDVVDAGSNLVGSITSLRTPKVPTMSETKTETLGGQTKVTHSTRTGHY